MKGILITIGLLAVALVPRAGGLLGASASGHTFERTEDFVREVPLDARGELPASQQPVQRLRRPPGPWLPGDGSLVASRVHLALVDLRQPGKAPALDTRQLSIIAQMARIGEAEGFSVAVAVPERDALSRAALAELANVALVTHGDADDLWLEDQGELDERGDALLPARLSDPRNLVRAVLRERIERIYPSAVVPESLPGLLAALAADAAPFRLAAFHSLGRMEDLRRPAPLADLARARGGAISEAATYLEGGNQLLGRMPSGEPYAIVGKDSVAASRAVLSERLGRAVDEGETLRAIARDLGLAPDHLFTVEQPGAFHLDLSMQLVGPKTVLLDDAEEGARLTERWLREDLALVGGGERERRQLEAYVGRMWEAARARAAAEELTARDLRAAGFAVHRLAGNFREAPRRMNLLNAFLATNPRGERYAVMFGGDPRAEEYVAEMLLHALPTELSRVHFLDRRESVPSGSGGLRCRVRALGSQVVPLGRSPRAPAALASASAGPSLKIASITANP